MSSHNAALSKGKVQGLWLEFSRSLSSAAVLICAETLIRGHWSVKRTRSGRDWSQRLEWQARGHSRTAELRWDWRWGVGGRKDWHLCLAAG